MTRNPGMGQTDTKATMAKNEDHLIEMHRKVAAYHASEARRARLGIVKGYHAEIARVLSTEADTISARHAARQKAKLTTLEDGARRHNRETS